MNTSNRPEQLKEQFLQLINEHLQELVAGRAEEMYEIEMFAQLLFVHPTHLSNTIQETTGKSPCYFYQKRIIEVAEELLSDQQRSVKDIALTLSFEPSNFTKWFKRFTGITPKQFRASKILK